MNKKQVSSTENVVGVAQSRLVRLGLISLQFVLMGKTFYVVIQAGGWEYSWKLSQDTINKIRPMMDKNINLRPETELMVREGLGYARVEKNK